MELNMANNNLNDYGTDRAIAISDAIPTIRALTSLDVSNNNNLGGHYDDSTYTWIFDMTGVKALAAAIPKCK